MFPFVPDKPKGMLVRVFLLLCLVRYYIYPKVYMNDE